MDRTDAIAWVLAACAGYLRLSQVKTLSSLVAGALATGRQLVLGWEKSLKIS